MASSNMGGHMGRFTGGLSQSLLAFPLSFLEPSSLWFLLLYTATCFPAFVLVICIFCDA